MMFLVGMVGSQSGALYQRCIYLLGALRVDLPLFPSPENCHPLDGSINMERLQVGLSAGASSHSQCLIDVDI